MFGFSPSELHAVPRVLIDLLCLLKYFVWRAWNDFRFLDFVLVLCPLLRILKRELSFIWSFLSSVSNLHGVDATFTASGVCAVWLVLLRMAFLNFASKHFSLSC